MSKKNKGAREFWMDQSGSLDKGKTLIFEAHTKKPRDWDTDIMDTSIHVISYDAFEKCQTEKQALEQRLVEVEKQLAVAVGAAKWSIRKIDVNLGRSGGYIHCLVADKLENALKQIEEMKK